MDGTSGGPAGGPEGHDAAPPAGVRHAADDNAHHVPQAHRALGLGGHRLQKDPPL